MTLSIRHLPNGPKTGYFTIGGHTFYYSYESIIGYRYADTCIRRKNVWGPTTGRHIKRLGIHDFVEYDSEEFYAIISTQLDLCPISAP